MNQKRILFVCGGVSEEHSISLLSASSLLSALPPHYDPVVVGIEKSGHWRKLPSANPILNAESARTVKLSPAGELAWLLPYADELGRALLQTATETTPLDAVFPILHGKGGEDGSLQGLLEMIGVPFVGSSCSGAAICLDKGVSKRLVEQAGYRVAPFVECSEPTLTATQKKQIEGWGFPVFVKASRQGSSVGVFKVDSAQRLLSALTEAFQFDSKCVIEKGIRGKELEVAVLSEGHHIEAAGVAELQFRADIPFYTYDAKYLDTSAMTPRIPADLTPAQTAELCQMAIHLFSTLDCYGMARLDFFWDIQAQKFIFNEANTIPGFTPLSLFPTLWKWAGTSYSRLVERLIQSAFVRPGLRLHHAHSRDGGEVSPKAAQSS